MKNRIFLLLPFFLRKSQGTEYVNMPVLYDQASNFYGKNNDAKRGFFYRRNAWIKFIQIKKQLLRQLGFCPGC